MKIDKILLIMMAGAMMASCASDNEAVGNEGQMPVNLNYITVQANETRAANDLNNTKLTSGKVKVNMKKHSDATWNTAVDYTVESDGSLTGGSDKFFYYNDGSTVDIIAYYPSTAGESFSVETDQSEDADYQKSDLMWATPIVNQSRTPATLTLQLNHQMAKISVKPIKAAGITKITSIKLKQVKPTVSFNQTTGAVGDADGTATEITVASNTTDGLTADGSVYYAAVIPAQTIDGGFLEIEADGETATYTLASSKTFESGHQYKLDITVSPSALGVSNNITGWDDSEAAIVGTANLSTPLIIDDIDDQEYTGSTITGLSLTVNYNGSTLDPSDYTVYYFNNIEPGLATVTVSYNGMYAAKSFNIIVPTTLAELKEWITASKAFDKCLGYYVTSTGAISTNSIGAIGIIAYLSTSDVDTSLAGTQNGLVLALSDESSAMAWASGYEASGVSRGNTDVLTGYVDTQTLNTKYGSTYAGGKCWIKGIAVSSLTQTHWFLPSKGQWNLMKGDNGMSAGNWTVFREKAMITNSTQNLIWSSTELNNNVAWHIYVLDGSWHDDHYKNGTYRVRACFAF